MDEERQKSIVSAIKDRYEQLRQARQGYEHSWMQIGRWMQPRRSFTLERTGNELRRRRIVDMTGAVAGERLAELLHGYLIDTHEPWIEPVLNGRDPSAQERRWFDDVERRMFEYFVSPRSTFRSTLMESTTDDVFFGNSAIWTGATQAGGLPVYKSLPLFECFWDEDEEGRVNTFYRRFKTTLKNAAVRYPTPKILEKRGRPNANLGEELEFVLAIEPRPDGVAGAPAAKKPFSSTIVSLGTDEVVGAPGGYDSFPIAVSRWARQAGDAYGVGPGWKALPLVVALNKVIEAIAHSAEHAAMPPLIDLTGKLERLDLRPGAVNSLDLADLMLMDGKDVIQKLYEGGEIRPAAEALVPRLTYNIELTFYVDWMRRYDGQPPSATQINDERDIRLKSLSGVVARTEQEKMQVISDRTFRILQNVDYFAQPPEALADEDIGFTYRSPLAIAQRQGRLRQVSNAMALIGPLAEIDPGVLDTVDAPETARDIMRAAGLPLRLVRDAETAAARQRQRAEQAAQREQLEQAQIAATAAESGARAVATAGGGSPA